MKDANLACLGSIASCGFGSACGSAESGEEPHKVGTGWHEYGTLSCVHVRERAVLRGCRQIGIWPLV